jgi:DNA-binding LacI/PurR family transcriptional regulator
MQTASTEAGLVGIIVPTAQGTFTPPIIEGASLALADHGYTLTVGISHGDPVRERLEVARLRRHPGCVGLLLLPLEESEDYDVIQNLYASKFPLVLIDHFPSEIPVDAVVSDDYHAGYEAASHLLDLGHRHVVFITSISERTSSVAARLTGFRQAVADRQIPLLQAPSLVVPRAPLPDDPSHRSWVRIEERIAKWLAAHPEVTGVITVHDRLATHVIRVARSLGRRVPEDLAIVSFGDYLSGEIQETPLTSVAMDLRGLGREAVRLLLSRLAEPQRSPVRVTLSTQLVIRASSDPSRVVLPIGT